VAAVPLNEIPLPGFVIAWPSGQSEVIPVDVLTDETHTLTNTVTDHPVEVGSNISDHSRPEPQKPVLKCIVSNTPLPGAKTRGTVVSDVVGASRSQAVWNRLEQLHNTPALVTAYTSLKVYDSMAIESVSVPRNARNANGLEFTVSLKRIRLVKNKQTTVVVASDTRAQPPKKTGTQQAQQPDQEPKSLAVQLAEKGATLQDSSNPILKGIGDFAQAALR